MKNQIHELYNLAKWKVQKQYVDNLEIDNSESWLIEINKIWDSIPTDRKDKFYYLVDKLTLNISDIDFVCRLTNLKYYIVTSRIHNFTTSDILKYIKINKIYDFDIFNKLDYEISDVENILKEDKVINRDFFSKYLHNKLIK